MYISLIPPVLFTALTKNIKLINHYLKFFNLKNWFMAFTANYFCFKNLSNLYINKKIYKCLIFLNKAIFRIASFAINVNTYILLLVWILIYRFHTFLVKKKKKSPHTIVLCVSVNKNYIYIYIYNIYKNNLTNVAYFQNR